MNLNISILSKRLRIRSLTRTDAEAFFRYRSLPEVCRYQSWQPKSLAEIEAFLLENEHTTIETQNAWHQLAVCLPDGTLIGDIGLHVLDEWQLELGYTLSPAYQGHGYATEAVASVLREAFAVWGRHRVTASVDPENAASVRLLERLGFRKEAHFRKSFRKDGEWYDDCVYAMLREEWDARAFAQFLPEPDVVLSAQIELIEAYSRLEDVKTLFQEYSASLGIDLEYQSFSSELSGLPGKYARPDGRLFLALVGGAPAGCVAMRRFGAARAEMKRLYVRPAFRGLSIGKRLAERVIEEARLMGYRSILLDTLGTMDRARQLYRRLGFLEITPYYDSPVQGTKFLQLTFKPESHGSKTAPRPEKESK